MSYSVIKLQNVTLFVAEFAEAKNTKSGCIESQVDLSRTFHFL